MRHFLILLLVFVVTPKVLAQPLQDLVYPEIDILGADRFTVVPKLGPERFINLSSAWSAPQTLLGGFQNMYNAQILFEEGAAYPYTIYFFGWAVKVCNRNVRGNSGCDAIFYARSQDGIRWEIYAGDDANGSPRFDASGRAERWRPIIQASNLFWDQWHNGDPSVVKQNGAYFMAFSSTGFNLDGLESAQAGDRDTDISTVAGAFSTDGIHWTKVSRPLLIAEGQPGKPEPFSNGTYHRPSLMIEDGKFKMWFDYWNDDGGLSMGYAELAGPITFENFSQGRWVILQGGDRPAIANWPNPDVIKVPGGYLSYADPAGYAAGWPGRKIAEAFSKDGLQWQIRGYIEHEAGCAANGVPSATLIRDEIVLTTGCQDGGVPYSPNYSSVRVKKRPL